MTGFEYFSAIAAFASAATALIGSALSASSIRDALSKVMALLTGRHNEPPGN